ncbi:MULTISPECIES: alpha/beta fold hydrolase [Halostella]|uniref:alpha/beta fold hydrolase n=1 Tax=Halostella TaxID=1843185 RepID=UPI001081B2B5|nr:MULTISPECIES: alpha/beta hydrolase [Halostella]
MPTASNEDTSLYYDISGEGIAGETVAFVGDVGYGAWLWGWQQPAVSGPFEALVWDLRGTGRSDAPPGPYDVATLADDLEAVLSDAGARNAHLVGVGLGGLVALEYAHRHSRAETLTLMSTAASGDEFEAPERNLFADPGDEAALRGSLDAAFSPGFRERQPDVVDGIVEWRRDGDAKPDAWRAQAAALESYDAGPLYEITCPAFVMCGEDDPVVSVSAAESLAAELPKGELAAFEGRHLFFVERSRPVNDRLQGFLEEHADLEL